MQKSFKIFLNDADWTKIRSRHGSGSDVGIRIRIQDPGWAPKEEKKLRISFFKRLDALSGTLYSIMEVQKLNSILRSIKQLNLNRKALCR